MFKKIYDFINFILLILFFIPIIIVLLIAIIGEKLKKGVCLVINHNWGNWNTFENNYHCGAERGCLRCGEKEVKSELHKWYAVEYINAYSCQLAQKCSLCGKKVVVSTHRGTWIYGKWIAKDDNYCQRERKCSWCGEQEWEEALHTWKVEHEETSIGGMCYTGSRADMYLEDTKRWSQCTLCGKTQYEISGRWV